MIEARMCFKYSRTSIVHSGCIGTNQKIKIQEPFSRHGFLKFAALDVNGSQSTLHWANKQFCCHSELTPIFVNIRWKASVDRPIDIGAVAQCIDIFQIETILYATH